MEHLSIEVAQLPFSDGVTTNEAHGTLQLRCPVHRLGWCTGYFFVQFFPIDTLQKIGHARAATPRGHARKSRERTTREINVCSYTNPARGRAHSPERDPSYLVTSYSYFSFITHFVRNKREGAASPLL